MLIATYIFKNKGKIKGVVLITVQKMNPFFRNST